METIEKSEGVGGGSGRVNRGMGGSSFSGAGEDDDFIEHDFESVSGASDIGGFGKREVSQSFPALLCISFKASRACVNICLTEGRNFFAWLRLRVNLSL